MKKKAKIIVGIFVLAVMLASIFGVFSTAYAAETKNDAEYFCLDSRGNPVYAHYAEKDAAWYLFIPSDIPVSEITLHYSGDVSEASKGNINAEEKTVTGAFSASGDSVELTLAGGAKNTVTVMQSNLPSVYIKLSDTTLETIHKDKNAKYQGNSIYLTDPSGEYNLTAENNLEIKGRGNSTWTLCDKKAYQIKFEEKTSVMGIGEAKKWVLLANATDDSLMRNQLIYRMAANMDMAYVPAFEYVDLWIDGEYLGNYLLGDKIELGSTRLDLKDDAGALFEHDEGFYMEEDHWFLSSTMGRHFALKEIVEEEDDIIASAMADFEADVDRFVLYLMTTPSSDITIDSLSEMIDVDSFIKYYIVNDYVLNHEGFVSSFYWYTDGADDVIHLGPIWDFDTCLGNEGSAYTDHAGKGHVLFNYLLAVPEFYERTQELKNEYMNDLLSMTDDVDVIKEEIRTSADMNYIRWDVLGKQNPKIGPDFHKTFDEATDFLKDWLSGRGENFDIPACTAVTTKVSEDCYTMDLCFNDGQEYGMVNFAVRSMDKDSSDVIWYSAEKNENGDWVSTVDLSRHNSAGIYSISAYADNAQRESAFGYAYVESAREPLYYPAAVVSEDCKTMTVTLDDLGKCEEISFAVWSEEGGQDDITWYNMQRNDEGIWEYNVRLAHHNSAGIYNIHFYSGDEVITFMQAEVEKAVNENIFEKVINNGVYLTVAVIILAAIITAIIFIIYRHKKRRK